MDVLINFVKFFSILTIILILSLAIFCPIIELDNKIVNLENKINIYHSNFCSECGHKI